MAKESISLKFQLNSHVNMFPWHFAEITNVEYSILFLKKSHRNLQIYFLGHDVEFKRLIVNALFDLWYRFTNCGTPVPTTGLGKRYISAIFFFKFRLLDYHHIFEIVIFAFFRFI